MCVYVLAVQVQGSPQLLCQTRKHYAYVNCVFLGHYWKHLIYISSGNNITALTEKKEKLSIGYVKGYLLLLWPLLIL